jgi:phospholipase D3/4
MVRRIIQSHMSGLLFLILQTLRTSLIDGANETIDISSLYITLSAGMHYPPSAKGSVALAVLNALLRALKRNVRVRVCVPWPSLSKGSLIDLNALQRAGAEIGKVFWNETTGMSGMMHAKYMIVDNLDLYVGSADFSYGKMQIVDCEANQKSQIKITVGALLQVKQLGVVLWNCPTMAQDATRIFEQFFSLRDGTRLPSSWPAKWDALTNMSTPFILNIGGGSAFLAMSPAVGFPSSGRGRLFKFQCMLTIAPRSHT